MPPPDPDDPQGPAADRGPRSGDPVEKPAADAPDSKAAAREAAAAARTLGRQLGILAASGIAGARQRGQAAGGRLTKGMAAAGAGLAARFRREPRTGAQAPPKPTAPGMRKTSAGLGGRPALAIGLALVALIAAASGAYLLVTLATLPPLGGVVTENERRAITVEADDGRVFATRGVFQGQKLVAADLPPHLAQAIVSIEDRRFESHWGVDPRGLARAAWRNVMSGGVREGASTITQQYVRLTSLTQEKTLRRKLQEALLALRAESLMTKQEILLGYLNTAYFGAGAYGVDAAAQRYFGKSAKGLTLPESAMLAGLVRAPSQLSPTRNFGGAKERADVVLQTMVETGAITAAAADGARAATITLRTPPETPPGTNFFLDVVAAEAKRLVDTTGDVTLRTTLSLDMQSLAEGVVARRLDAEGQKKKVGQAAMVVLSKDGAVLAMVGGRDYEESQFNRATQAKRQAGSLFKLFVYLAGYEKGFTPETVLVDRPIKIGDWEPQNANNRFRGAVPLRTAFALSINTVAAQMADEVGVPAVIEAARRLGVQSELPEVPSLALGSASVTLLEMTRAYAGVLVNQAPLSTFTIHAIRGRDPKPLYVHPDAKPGQPIAADARAMMLDSLQAVVDSGTGKAARIANIPVGGKTGTTQDYRDAWFVGVTPDLVVGIWVGNDDNSSMNKVSGGDLPAAMFRDFIQRASAQMAKAAKRPSAARAAPAPAAQPAPAPSDLRGAPEVIDTGTLSFRGRVVRLIGVEGESGALARQLARYLRRREVTCAPEAGAPEAGRAEADAPAMRCRIDGDDLASLILTAGGARASEDAPSDLLAAEEQARSERAGLWRRSR